MPWVERRLAVPATCNGSISEGGGGRDGWEPGSGVVPTGPKARFPRAGLDTVKTLAYISGHHSGPLAGPLQHCRGGQSMTTRREFLATTLAATAGAALAPRRATAAPKTMTVVRESSFIKAFDDYFAKTLLPEYEKMTGIKMSYDAVSVGGMLTRLTTIIETKSGPEIAMTGLNQ